MFPKILLYFFLFIAILWLVAVYKVFVLDDGSTDIIVLSDASAPVQPAESNSQLEAEVTSKQNPQNNYVPQLAAFETARAIRNVKVEVKPKKIVKLDLPKVDTIKQNVVAVQPPAKQITKPTEVVPKPVDTVTITNPSELKWPPVLPDGSFPPSDGYDIMPITNLKVPKFWYPPKGEDWNTAGSKVNGEETIFLMIASYRDFQCHETINIAYQRADHPERLFVAAVDQIVPGDVGCLDIEVPCDQNPNQPICKYRNQISIYKMDAKYATGPVTARHVGDRMYRGEYFVMQLDAHCMFVNHWDSKIIAQWRSTQNEMAVLSSYLSDVQGSIDKNGDSLRHTRPIMCNSDFEGLMPARYLRHGSQPEDSPEIKGIPQLQPFWAAGFSFSRGHFKLRVPYDAYQPMVFQGEEIAIGIRGFTHGYDFYAPVESVVFHEYAEMSSRRKKIHMFWENSEVHKGEGQKSLRRATAVIGMAPDLDPTTWDHSELDRYGLGTGIYHHLHLHWYL